MGQQHIGLVGLSQVTRPLGFRTGFKRAVARGMSTGRVVLGLSQKPSRRVWVRGCCLLLLQLAVLLLSSSSTKHLELLPPPPLLLLPAHVLGL